MLMARANTARGAAHFLRETVGRVRYAGARGQLTVRADSGFYTHAVVAACRKLRCASPSLLHRNLRRGIEAIPEAWRPFPTGWRVPPTWRDGLHPLPERARRRTGAAHCPAGETHVRQLALFASYSYHACITGT